MPDEADILDADADPYLRLLTDALRAGPGSAEWASAVAAARARGDGGVDDHAVLLAARDRLASGREYRSVRAGPGFGRRLMTQVDADLAARPRSLVSPGLLAMVGTGVVVGVVGLLLSIVFRSGSGVGAGPGDLGQAYFPRTFASATLTDPLPPGWRSIGSLSLDATKRLALPADWLPGTADAQAGGLATRAAIQPDEPLSVQATFHFGHVGPGCVPQLFVADGNDFTPDRGVAPHEVVWLVQDGQGQVATADGRVADPRLKVHDHDEVTVKLVVAAGGDAAVVCDKQVLWTGNSRLADRPRYAGVRLLYRGNDARRDAVTVTGLQVRQK